MLFQSTVPHLFNNLHKQIFDADNQARKAEAAKRLNLYHDAQLPYLENMLEKMFSDPDRMVKIYLNIVRKIINNLAQIYRVPRSERSKASKQTKRSTKTLPQPARSMSK